ncbi:LPS assembly lipoprotein LptE [Candidatus Nitrospira bockiana]
MPTSPLYSALSTQPSAFRRIFGLVLAAGLVAGCGYQFQVEGPGPTIGGGAAEPIIKPGAPTLTIENFINRSLEPNLELKYTAYAFREFSNGSGARVVTGNEPSDLVLKGSIVSVIVPTLTFDISRTVESRVTVFVQATVEKTKTKEVIWSQLATASSEYFVTNDLQFNRVLQARALEQAGRFIVQDLATRFLTHLETYGLKPAPAAPAGSVPPEMMPGGTFQPR